MADPMDYGDLVASRTYWTKVVKDKNGKPSTVTTNDSTGGDETQYRELTYKNSRGQQSKVVEKWSPQKEAWEPQTADTKGVGASVGGPKTIQSGGDTYQEQLDGSYKKIIDNPDRPHSARFSELQAPASQKKIITLDENGQRVESDNPNYKSEPTVTRPIGRQTGPEGQDLGMGHETVSVHQDDADRERARLQQVADQNAYSRQHTDLQDQRAANHDQRQLELDIANAANRAAELVISQGHLDVARGNATRAEAAAKVNAELEKIRLQVEERTHAITMRGQDISSQTAQRGQNLDYEASLASAGTNLAGKLLEGFIGPNQMARINSIQSATGPGSPIAPMMADQAPFTPSLPLQLAQQARAQIPAPLALPGAPPPVNYTLPG